MTMGREDRLDVQAFAGGDYPIGFVGGVDHHRLLGFRARENVYPVVVGADGQHRQPRLRNSASQLQQPFGVLGEIEVGIEGGMKGVAGQGGDQGLGPFVGPMPRCRGCDASEGIAESLHSRLMMTKHPPV